MDTSSLGVFVPIAAIVMWGIAKIQRQALELRQSNTMLSNSKSNQDVMAELQRLQAEVASLRETSTQYDLSIDHYLKDLDQRLKTLEHRPYIITASAPPDQIQQTNITGARDRNR